MDYIEPPVLFEIVKIIQFGNDDIKHYKPMVVSRFNVLILSDLSDCFHNSSKK